MKIIQIILTVVFISFVTIMLIKQGARKKQLYHMRISAKVVAASKGLKGYYDVLIMQDDKLRHLDFSYADNSLTANMGDSIYKEENSDIFYVRKVNMSEFRKLDLADADIHEK